jgi:hypothetical protein
MKKFDIDIFCIYCCKENPHRWRPSPEAGPHWRCSECGDINTPKQIKKVGVLEKLINFFEKI